MCRFTAAASKFVRRGYSDAISEGTRPLVCRTEQVPDCATVADRMRAFIDAGLDLLIERFTIATASGECWEQFQIT